ncbi:hypothetical protein [Enterococcus innesii]|uniref:hypothetical protein n=1 Tax=Enterococcus innesii TaxID=2839759 RepID=UPI002DB84119|nr:hypothetical protein [Enterococcus innesii]MEB5953092.1 hypothetical protein [Enterococcus innesii]
MGLDMWLSKKKGKNLEEIAYWRKANQIREFFVTYVPDEQHENIENLPITLEMLATLEERINKCLKDKDINVCERLLPTSSGFFFGSTEYDSYYFEDLEMTLPFIKIARNEIENGNHVIYHEWW